jgi:Protein of unknown function (DUF1569)|tara:strand:- start:11 stop:502 length:492 start_codon:yes stop_codon:yes gene_type:complete
MPVADKSKWSPKTFRSIDELSAELDRIEAAHQSGTLSTAGGWTPGQCMSHTAVFIKSSYDGFELGAPWILRAVCSLLLKPIATKPKSQMKPGIKLPAKAKELLPEDAVSVEEGIAQMRTQIARIKSGEQMTQVSPLLGKMSHEQWVNLHLNHCRMHFGFFSYE